MSTQRSDYELAQAVSHGTTSSLTTLYERHSRRVYALCLRMTGDVSEAEDLTQEVFIQLLNKVGSFRGDSQFKTWLHRLTVNQVLMHFRRKVRRREYPGLLDELTTNRLVKYSVNRQMIEHLALESAMAKLPTGSRSVFLKFDLEGYNHQEIAATLGCSTGNTKSQLHKARKKLRKLLA